MIRQHSLGARRDRLRAFAAIEAEHGAVDRLAIHAATGLDRCELSKWLCRSRQRGIVERVALGRYRLTERGRRELARLETSTPRVVLGDFRNVQYARRAGGQCRDCGKDAPSGCCDECRTERNAALRAWREARREAAE